MISKPAPKEFPRKVLDTISLGDCLEILGKLPDASVDLVVSSPPYNIGKGKEVRRPLDRYLEGQRAVLAHCARALRPTGSLFWQVGSYTNAGVHVPLDVKVFPILEGLGLTPRNRIVWIRSHGLHAKNRFSGRHETLLWFTKTDDYRFFLDPIRVPQKYPEKKEWERNERHGHFTSDPLGKNPGDVWAFRNVQHNHDEQTTHPAQFPEDLIERVVLATTEEGDVILDPYMGSGTVAVVARALGRHFIGAETEPEYLELARRRLAGVPDEKLRFPNLKTLRQYAKRHRLTDLSRLRFDRQVGRVPTPADRAKVYPEQTRLELIVQGLEWEAEHPAAKRASEQGDAD